MGLHQGNDVIGNPDIGHCLLHDKRKEDDGHRGNHVAKAVHRQITEPGKAHFASGNIEYKAHCNRSNHGQKQLSGNDCQDNQHAHRQDKVHEAALCLKFRLILLVERCALRRIDLAGLLKAAVSGPHPPQLGNNANDKQRHDDNRCDGVKGKGDHVIECLYRRSIAQLRNPRLREK